MCACGKYHPINVDQMCEFVVAETVKAEWILAHVDVVDDLQQWGMLVQLTIDTDIVVFVTGVLWWSHTHCEDEDKEEEKEEQQNGKLLMGK